MKAETKITRLYNIAIRLCIELDITGLMDVCEAPKTARYLGLCDLEPGIIFIRIRTLGKKARYLKESTCVDTLCHELAHLVVWTHGAEHKKVERMIRRRAKRLGFRR